MQNVGTREDVEAIKALMTICEQSPRRAKKWMLAGPHAAAFARMRGRMHLEEERNADGDVLRNVACLILGTAPDGTLESQEAAMQSRELENRRRWPLLKSLDKPQAYHCRVGARVKDTTPVGCSARAIALAARLMACVNHLCVWSLEFQALNPGVHAAIGWANTDGCTEGRATIPYDVFESISRGVQVLDYMRTRVDPCEDDVVRRHAAEQVHLVEVVFEVDGTARGSGLPGYAAVQFSRGLLSRLIHAQRSLVRVQGDVGSYSAQVGVDLRVDWDGLALEPYTCETWDELSLEPYASESERLSEMRVDAWGVRISAECIGGSIAARTKWVSIIDLIAQIARTEVNGVVFMGPDAEEAYRARRATAVVPAVEAG